MLHFSRNNIKAVSVPVGLPPVSRIKFLIIVFLLTGIVLVGRLFMWQVVRAEQLSLMGKSQHQTDSVLSAHRGSILASDSYPLVSPIEGFLLWASLKDIQNPEDISRKLASLTVEDPVGVEASMSALVKEDMIKVEEERLYKLLTKKDIVWVALKNKINKKQKIQIEEMKIKGLGFDIQDDRGYAEGSMAAHILGFVGKDSAGESKGYFGLEGYYDLSLSGREGVKSWEKDVSGSPILVGSSRQVAAHDGLTLKTNINRSVQFMVEKRLKEGVERYEAKAGTVIVIRPKDGAILAMASYPAYDPKKYSLYPKESYTDPAVGESFEPGSIFKVLIMAAALDMEAIEPDTKCGDCDGPRTIAEYTIDSGNGEYHPDSDMATVIKNSDNVGMVWIAEKMGLEKVYEYITKFGIGEKTGIDLQGEEAPKVRRKDDWGHIDLATASFGQGIAVTPIQMVRAVAALANKGWLATPHIVEKVIGDSVEEKVEVPEPKQVISEEAAKEITDMMVNNVNSKAKEWNSPPGFRIAGKTGTAQVPIEGHYDDTKTVASFVGFAPAENSEFAMIVSLKSPQTAPWASQTAAPLWFNIARDILPILGAKPTQN